MMGTDWDGDNKKECDGDNMNDMLDNFSDMEFDWLWLKMLCNAVH